MSRLLAAKLETLRTELGFLESRREVTWDEFKRDPLLQRAVERSLQVAIEAALDLGRILIRENRWPEAATNREVFRVLAAQGVLSESFLHVLEPLASFRNLLVHEYGELDKAAVYGVLRDHLEDLRRYGGRIEGWGETGEGPA